MKRFNESVPVARGALADDIKPGVYQYYTERRGGYRYCYVLGKVGKYKVRVIDNAGGYAVRVFLVQALVAHYPHYTAKRFKDVIYKGTLWASLKARGKISPRVNREIRAL